MNHPLLSATRIYQAQVCANFDWFQQVECLPLCEYLECHDLPLTHLPDLPMCQQLICSINRLTYLPDLPMCQQLCCVHNQLTQLPDLPMCRQLYCGRNQLTQLPDLSECDYLECNGNPDLYYTQEFKKKLKLSDSPFRINLTGILSHFPTLMRANNTASPLSSVLYGLFPQFHMLLRELRSDQSYTV